MNSKIRSYVNYLLDNNPSPFCDYIICKELLGLDEKAISDSYEWAKRFKLYTEISDEQFPDGSWGGFIDALSSTDAKRRKYKATARAINRLVDLSLDINDSMVTKTVDLCMKYLSGELVPICISQLPSHNIGQATIIKREICRCLSYFVPDYESVVMLRNEAVECFAESCEKGHFDEDFWKNTDFNTSVGLYAYEASIHLLSYGKVISDELQHMLLSYEWEERIHFGNVKPSVIISPDEPLFVFWIHALERLKDFSLFGEYMSDKVAPYLYSICEKLVDNNYDTSINVNRYFGKIGQYSESWNNLQSKKNDLLLRIIRLLDRCE